MVATLERVCARIGVPKVTRVGQGSEFISQNMYLWAYRHGVVLDALIGNTHPAVFNRHGKPMDNVYIEEFNARLRAECPNAHSFLNLADAVEKLEAWLRDHNEERLTARSETRSRLHS